MNIHDQAFSKIYIQFPNEAFGNRKELISPEGAYYPTIFIC